MDYSPPGSSVHGIPQARILEWVATSFSRGSSQLRDQTKSPALAGGFFTMEPAGKPVSLHVCVCVCVCVCVLVAQSCQLFATPWTIVCQTPLSMEFSTQEYWTGLTFVSPGDHPNPGIKPGFPSLLPYSLPSEPPGKPTITYATAAKSLQSCLTLCEPIDGNPPGSPIPGILQARTLEWVAISFSSAWKWKMKVKSLSCVRLLATPWTTAYQAPPSTEFSRQEDWNGVPMPSPIITYTPI